MTTTPNIIIVFLVVVARVTFIDVTPATVVCTKGDVNNMLLSDSSVACCCWIRYYY